MTAFIFPPKDNCLQWVIQVFALVSKILDVHACVPVHVCVWAAKFHFQFCSVYPADSLQSVDKEAAMTARANVAKLHRGWQKKNETDGCQLWTTLYKRTDL